MISETNALHDGQRHVHDRDDTVDFVFLVSAGDEWLIDERITGLKRLV